MLVDRFVEESTSPLALLGASWMEHGEGGEEGSSPRHPVGVAAGEKRACPASEIIAEAGEEQGRRNRGLWEKRASFVLARLLFSYGGLHAADGRRQNRGQVVILHRGAAGEGPRITQGTGPGPAPGQWTFAPRCRVARVLRVAPSTICSCCTVSPSASRNGARGPLPCRRDDERLSSAFGRTKGCRTFGVASQDWYLLS